MIRNTCTLLFLLTLAMPAAAQSRQTFRVQVHGGGDPILREQVAAAVTSSLKALNDVEIVVRDPEYLVSVIVLPTTNGGYVMSMAVMNIHTDEALSNFAVLWNVPEASRDRMRAMFRGTGSLVDQRVLTGTNLDAMAADIARSVNADTLATRR